MALLDYLIVEEYSSLGNLSSAIDGLFIIPFVLGCCTTIGEGFAGGRPPKTAATGPGLREINGVIDMLAEKNVFPKTVHVHIYVPTD